jgi:hypothetical protein
MNVDKVLKGRNTAFLYTEHTRHTRQHEPETMNIFSFINKIMGNMAHLHASPLGDTSALELLLRIPPRVLA